MGTDKQAKRILELLIKQMLEKNSTYSIDKCCYEWEPHQKLLHDLAEYFKDKEIPCSL